jgi:hypothetical protein
MLGETDVVTMHRTSTLVRMIRNSEMQWQYPMGTRFALLDALTIVQITWDASGEYKTRRQPCTQFGEPRGHMMYWSRDQSVTALVETIQDLLVAQHRAELQLA